MKNLIIKSSVLAIAIALAGAAFSQTEAPIADRVLKDLRNKNPDVRIAAFEQLYAAEQDALENNRPISATIRKAVIDLLQFEANQPPPQANTRTENEGSDEGGNEEYIPELIESVTALHDPKTIDLLLNPWVLGTGLTTSELTSYGESIIPKLLATYQSPPANPNKYDSAKTVRGFVMFVMTGMLDSGLVTNRQYLNQIESIFIENARLSATEGLALALRLNGLRGLQYFTDIEARTIVQDSLEDSDVTIRQVAERSIKAQKKLLGEQ